MSCSFFGHPQGRKRSFRQDEFREQRSDAVVDLITDHADLIDRLAAGVGELPIQDVVREVNLDLVAKGDKETAAIVVPEDAAGPPRAAVVSYTNP